MHFKTLGAQKTFSALQTIGIVAVTGCALVACSSNGGSSNSMSGEGKRAKVIADSKQRCTELGYEDGTKEFRDCTTNQFNRMSEKYYGPLN